MGDYIKKENPAENKSRQRKCGEGTVSVSSTMSIFVLRSCSEHGGELLSRHTDGAPHLGIATVLMSIYIKRVDNFLYGVA